MLTCADLCWPMPTGPSKLQGMFGGIDDCLLDGMMKDAFGDDVTNETTKPGGHGLGFEPKDMFGGFIKFLDEIDTGTIPATASYLL